MTKKTLIVHGWGGSDFPHWQSWLATEIAKDYGYVHFLRFTNFEYPDFNTWKSELKECLEEFQPDIVVCHSIANIIWFHLCNDEKIQSIKKLYLVAPPSLSCDIKELESFYPIKVPKKLFSKETLLITSTNDPYMSIDEANKLFNTLSEKDLNIKMEVLQDGGHINTDSGFGEWQWLLEQVKA